MFNCQASSKKKTSCFTEKSPLNQSFDEKFRKYKF